MQEIIGLALVVFFIFSMYEFNRSFGDVKARLDRIEKKLDKSDSKQK